MKTSSSFFSSFRLLLPVPLSALFLFLFFLPCFSIAQSNTLPPEDENSELLLNEEMKQNIEMQAETGDPENTDYSELTETAERFLRHPLQINSAGQDELRALALLNDIQIANLLEHIRNQGPLLSVYELQAVNGFDVQTIRSLLPYITVESRSENIAGRTEHHFINRAGRILESQKGFAASDTAVKKTATRYLGSPLKYYSAYRCQTTGRFSFGISGKKDAGEEFFRGSEKQGFDFWSAHLSLHHYGIIKTLVLGDYSAGFGQGLLAWSGISLSKTTDAAFIKKTASGFRPYTSTNENGFMRGAAITLQKGILEASLFFSRRKIDASVSDTSIAGTVLQVRALQSSGLHATPAALASRQSLGQTVVGGGLALVKTRFKMGITGMQTSLDASLEPRPAPYNLFGFRGKLLQGASADYNLIFRNVLLFGEAALSRNQQQTIPGSAFVQGLLLLPDPKLTIALLARSYGRDYYSFYANGFSEGSKTSNEQGAYMGAVFKPSAAIKVSAFYDCYLFPWLRYRVNAPVTGSDFFLRLSYQPDKNTEMYFSFRQHEKASDPVAAASSEEINFPLRGSLQNLRFHISAKLKQGFEIRSRLDLIEASDSLGMQEKGYMLAQDLIFRAGKRMVFTLSYALFDTPGGNTRIYAFEHTVPGSFSVPSFFARGSHLNTMLRFKAGKSLQAWIQVSRTFYDSKNIISPGTLNEIDAAHQTEVTVQILLRLVAEKDDSWRASSALR